MVQTRSRVSLRIALEVCLSHRLESLATLSSKSSVLLKSFTMALLSKLNTNERLCNMMPRLANSKVKCNKLRSNLAFQRARNLYLKRWETRLQAILTQTWSSNLSSLLTTVTVDRVIILFSSKESLFNKLSSVCLVHSEH